MCLSGKWRGDQIRFLRPTLIVVTKFCSQVYLVTRSCDPLDFTEIWGIGKLQSIQARCWVRDVRPKFWHFDKTPRLVADGQTNGDKGP